MVVEKSPEWLPPGFIEKTKYRNGKKIRYYQEVETGKKYNSKKDVMLATVDSGKIVTPQEENGDDNVLSSDNKADDILSKTNDSPAWLPNGWKIEEKIRHSGSSKGSAYKVYIDSSGEKKLYSKAAVIRYLNTPNHANTSTVQKVDNLDELNVIKTNANMSNVDDLKIVDLSSIDTSPQPVSMTKTGGSRKNKSKHKSFEEVSRERTTDDDLPPGWIKEIRTSKSGAKIRKDPYYIDPVSHYEFRSKLDALRYLESNDINKCRIKPLKGVADGEELTDNTIPVDNLEELNVIKTNANESNVDDLKIVDLPSIDTSPQPVSMTETGGSRKNKSKLKSFETVSVERRTDDDLPPGWIKEIRTSKSGARIRKDSYYIDPVSHYEFRSKLDALRYLESNDINQCRIKPLKGVADGEELTDNTIPSTNPANDKFSVHKRHHLLGGKSNGDKECSGTKIIAESEEQMHGNLEPDSFKVTSVFEEKIPCENAEKNVEMINDPEPETGSSTKQQPSESGKAPSGKSKKRKGSSVSLRTSKRLAGSHPEMDSNSDLNERFLRAAARGSSALEVDKSFKDPASIPMPSEIGPKKEAFTGEETHQDPVMEVEYPPTEGPLNEEKEPLTAVPVIQDEQLGGDAGEKQINEGKQFEESHLYDFGDAWSYPMEFALNIFRGDIPIDDCPNEQISLPSIKDGLSQSDAPEFASHSGSSKPQNDHLPHDAIFGSIFGEFDNFQDGTEVGKTDSQTKSSP